MVPAARSISGVCPSAFWRITSRATCSKISAWRPAAQRPSRPHARGTGPVMTASAGDIANSQSKETVCRPSR